VKTAPCSPEIPPTPTDLDKDGRAEWQRLVAHLKQQGNLCLSDATILRITCQTYSDLMRLLRFLNRHGRTVPSGGSHL